MYIFLAFATVIDCLKYYETEKAAEIIGCGIFVVLVLSSTQPGDGDATLFGKMNTLLDQIVNEPTTPISIGDFDSHHIRNG
mmetsp:Transcript_10204/g.18088  ORF Transcript_10204/g.18088 Transcript_10204/m.18088 type:complete len:81 (-) Transcript_10204:49-291(-)